MAAKDYHIIWKLINLMTPSIAMSLPGNRNLHVQGPSHMGVSETGVHSQLWLS